MTQNNANNDLEMGGGMSQRGDEVMHQSGILDAAAEQLSESSDCSELEPEAVGKWITAIGKALLAILKP